MKVPRLRYSLRTLMLFTLLAGAGMALWRAWDPRRHVKLTHPNATRDLDFSPNGERVAVCQSKSCVIWNIAGRTPYQIKTLAFDQEVHHACWSPEASKLYVSMGPDALVFDTRDWGAKRLTDGSDLVRCIFSPDASRVLTRDFRIYWDLNSGKPLRTLSMDEHFSGFSPDSRHFLINQLPASAQKQSGALVLCDARNAQEIWRVNPIQGAEQYEALVSAEFKPERARLAARFARILNEDATLFEVVFEREYDLTTGELIVNRAVEKIPWKSRTFSEDDYVPGAKYEKKLGEGKQSWWITDAKGTQLEEIPKFSFDLEHGDTRGNVSRDGRCIATWRPSTTTVALWWRQLRPEHWWGLAYLWEFWAVVVLFAAVIWSFVRDWRS